MKPFVAFASKEFTEGLRTYRLIILAVILLFLGLMSPLFAKILPELLSGMDLGGGIVITAPAATAIDSWAQFFKNVGQTGMLALIVTFSGIIGSELTRGTLIILLTKGLKRHTVIMAKFLSASVMWTASYLLSLAVCYVYTQYFWPAGTLNNAFLAFVSLWLFGELLIALLIFGGVLFGSSYGSLLTGFGAIGILSLLNVFPSVHKYNPITLASDALNLLTGHKPPTDFIPATVVSIFMVVAFLAMSIVVFNRKQI
ncbi:MAG: hypothetical protein KGZ66_07785 [Selenomonadales bacterium]|jgi:ABC-2 type transport system permease protein|nr:hypothetical protein [Selenomonadales bacterium]